jgi:hypothetical protein
MLFAGFQNGGPKARRFRFHHGRDTALKRALGFTTVPRDE